MIATSLADGGSRREVTVLALVAGVTAFVVILYLDTFVAMAKIWQSSGYRHGLIVPPICAYLLWRQRATLAATELRPCISGIVPLLGIVALWFVARSVGVQVVEFLAAVLLIPAALLVSLGWLLARRAMFPLLFLVAAVPIGDGMVPYLMQITANIATTLLQAFGVPVFREGQFLSLPGGNFEVASVCAGLAYLTAGTVIAILSSYLTFRSVAKRFAFVMATVAVMIVTNGVRAFTVMYVASATHMRYLAGRDHILFGWILFGAVVVLLIHVGGRFADQGMQQELSGGGATTPAERARWSPVIFVFGLVMLAATAQPLQTGLGDSRLWMWPAAGVLVWTLYRTIDSFRSKGPVPEVGGAHYRSAQGALVLVVAAVALGLGPGLLRQPTAGVDAEPISLVPPPIDDCARAGDWSESWAPEFHFPDAVMSGSYVCSARRVNAFVATYTGNAQGRELVNHENRAVPDALLWRAATGQQDFMSKDGEMIRVNELQIGQPGPASMVWYWYQTGDTPATNVVFIKLKQALDLLLMRKRDATAYVLSTSVGESVVESRRDLAAVARVLTTHETAGSVSSTASLVESAPQ